MPATTSHAAVATSADLYDRLVLVDNTCTDSRLFHAEIIAAVRGSGQLPEELSDVFTLAIRHHADGRPFGILELADDN